MDSSAAPAVENLPHVITVYIYIKGYLIKPGNQLIGLFKSKQSAFFLSSHTEELLENNSIVVY